MSILAANKKGKKSACTCVPNIHKRKNERKEKRKTQSIMSFLTFCLLLFKTHTQIWEYNILKIDDDNLCAKKNLHKTYLKSGLSSFVEITSANMWIYQENNKIDKNHQGETQRVSYWHVMERKPKIKQKSFQTMAQQWKRNKKNQSSKIC